MMAYPVTVGVEPQIANRDRLTTAFRLILAIPHLILVGGPGVSLVATRSNGWLVGGQNGLLGAAAFVMAIVSWFTILVWDDHPEGIREFTRYYLRWHLRVAAYVALLTDEYPPFGDREYPTTIAVVDPPAPRDRITVGLRLLLVIPHVIVLVFVGLAWLIVTIAAWFIILFTGAYPEGVARFSTGVLRWYFRVEAYTLLMVDEYPPFSLD